MKRTWQAINNWERWPFFLIYAPLGFVWVYYVLRARAFWFFSPVNPTLEFSGFEGESKKEMYELMPASLYPKTIYVKPKQDYAEILTQISGAGIAFPLVAKPDRGMQGVLFRKLDSEQELQAYHARMPVEYVVQDFIDLPLEFSVFHLRYPGEQKGKLTGFILKEYLKVTGDGKSDLLTLIQQNPRATYRVEEMQRKHARSLGKVLLPGEPYFLSYAGNHNRGARFINLHNEIDDALRSVFDKISLDCKTFFYGRYDLKCTSIDDLKKGKNISILEFNGTGAEPNHIYDCRMSYAGALAEVAKHWDYMYRIGRINNKNGVPYWGLFKGLKFLSNAKKSIKMLRRADLEH